MANPVAHSRRQALRALRWQTIAAFIVALVCGLWPTGGWPAVAAALAGGTVMVLSAFAAMLVALGGRPSGGGAALGRVLAGVLVKWGVVTLGLLLVLGVARLPPLPVVIVVIAMVMAYIAANAFPQRVV